MEFVGEIEDGIDTGALHSPHGEGNASSQFHIPAKPQFNILFNLIPLYNLRTTYRKPSKEFCIIQVHNHSPTDFVFLPSPFRQTIASLEHSGQMAYKFLLK